eukprot:744700_1
MSFALRQTTQPKTPSQHPPTMNCDPTMHRARHSVQDVSTTRPYKRPRTSTTVLSTFSSESLGSVASSNHSPIARSTFPLNEYSHDEQKDQSKIRGPRWNLPRIGQRPTFIGSAHYEFSTISPFGTSSMEILSDDALSNVAIFFTARELCGSLARVCRTWRRVTVCALRQVKRADFKQRAVMLAPSFGTEISVSSTRSFLRTLRTRCPHLTSLSLNVNFSVGDISDVLDVCGDSLTELTLPPSCITNEKSTSSAEALLSFAQKTQNLRKLSLRCVELADTSQICFDLDSDDLEKLARLLPYLTCLNIEQCQSRVSRMTGGILRLARHCRNLQSLSVSYCDGFFSGASCVLNQKLRFESLTELYIRNGDMCDVELEGVGRLLCELRVLRLRGVRVSQYGFLHLEQKDFFRSLRSLRYNCRGCSGIAEYGHPDHFNLSETVHKFRKPNALSVLNNCQYT